MTRRSVSCFPYCWWVAVFNVQQEPEQPSGSGGKVWPATSVLMRWVSPQSHS
jgi:hypothetical protein